VTTYRNIKEVVSVGLLNVFDERKHHGLLECRIL